MTELKYKIIKYWLIIFYNLIKVNYYEPAGPVGPAGIVRFRTKLGEVPVIVAAASVPGSPVVTVPIVKVGVVASAPVGPVGPVGPVEPFIYAQH